MRPCYGPNGPDTKPTTRRAFLRHAGFGFGTIALAALLREQGLLSNLAEGAEPRPVLNPLAPKKPPHRARAQNIIFLFMSGGPSHLETFDPKPELQRLHGERLTVSFGPVKTRRGVDKNRLLATRRTFRKHGQSSIEVSDLFPHLFSCVDDLCVLRGCHGDSV